MAALDISPERSALLVMDCQEGIVGGLPPAERDKVLTNVARAIKCARDAHLPVMYVVVQFRPGHPEISRKNARFNAAKEKGLYVEGADGTKICAALQPAPGDVIVAKKRIGAFTGSDLELILQAAEIDTLVLTGVSTVGVVESTARAGFDKDYRVIVLGDCCADSDPEANTAALKYVLPMVSTVASLAEFEASLS